MLMAGTEALQQVDKIARGFRWAPPATFLSSPLAPWAVMLAYILAAYSANRVVQLGKQQPRGAGTRWRGAAIRAVMAGHNLVLCALSVAMCAGGVHALREKGWEWAVCMPEGTVPAGRAYFWGYVYYLSKYYELFDTALVVLKGGELTFLHVFHHALVIPMAYYWIDSSMSTYLLGLVTNTSVHVPMYLYFFLTSLGVKPRWKHAITLMQLTQFAFSFLVFFDFLRRHLGSVSPPLRCEGALSCCLCALFNASLFSLFLRLYRRNRSSPHSPDSSASSKPRRSSARWRRREKAE